MKSAVSLGGARRGPHWVTPIITSHGGDTRIKKERIIPFACISWYKMTQGNTWCNFWGFGLEENVTMDFPHQSKPTVLTPLLNTVAIQTQD